jgi:hypothetical protein
MLTRSSSLHGLSALRYLCSCRLMEEAAGDELGVHHPHQFGEDHSQVLMLQVCFNGPSSWKEVDAVCLPWIEHD